MSTFIIRNGSICIGDGSSCFNGDILVADGIIRSVRQGRIAAEDAEVIDASGLIVSPGFIDMHSHSDLTLLVNPQGESKLSQGVTTEVVGNCGLTAFPVADSERRKSLGYIDIPSMQWTWKTTDEYVSIQLANPSALNTVPFVGHGGIRAAVMGYENRLAGKKELSAMQDLLQAHFDKGFQGLSTGLGYAPDFYSNEDELCALAEVCAANSRCFSFHVRGERDTLFKAIAEVLSVGRRTGAEVEISHMKCAHVTNVGKMSLVLQMVEEARRAGVKVNFDHYPYTAGNSYLGLVFPPWAHEGGLDALLERLSNPATRERIKHDMVNGTDSWASMIAAQNGSNIVISNVPEQLSGYIGKSLADIAKAEGVSVPEISCRLMGEASGSVEVLLFQQTEEDLCLAMKNPLGMFGSDGYAMDCGKVIQKGRPHPRSFGTFPRILGHYVKEEGVIPLEEAIRKMTSLPASKVGLHDRGLLKEGMKADITIFDFDSVIDNATYADPFRYSSGIRYVFVNGDMAYHDGAFLETRSGKFLLRR